MLVYATLANMCNVNIVDGCSISCTWLSEHTHEMATAAAEEGEKGLGEPAPVCPTLSEKHKANPQAPSLQATNPSR